MWKEDEGSGIMADINHNGLIEDVSIDYNAGHGNSWNASSDVWSTEWYDFLRRQHSTKHGQRIMKQRLFSLYIVIIIP